MARRRGQPSVTARCRSATSLVTHVYRPAQLIACGVALASALLAGCSGSWGVYCSPAPSISGTPSEVATAGFVYEYYPHARYSCWIATCSAIEAVQLPRGANAGAGMVTWTPSLDQVGTRQRLEIRTPDDT